MSNTSPSVANSSSSSLSTLSSIVSGVSNLVKGWQAITELVSFINGQQSETQQMLNELSVISQDLQQGFNDVIAQLKEDQAFTNWQQFAGLITQMNTVINDYSLEFTTINTTTQTVQTISGQETLDNWSWDKATHCSTLVSSLHDACVSGSSELYMDGLFDTWVDLMYAAQQNSDATIGTNTVYFMSQTLLADLLSAAFNLIMIHEYCYRIRVTAGYSLSGQNTYANNSEITLVSMCTDSAVLSGLGSVSSPPPECIMTAFDQLMTSKVEQDISIGSYIIRPPQNGTPQSPINNLGGVGYNPLFFVGSYTLSPADLANGVVITGLRWAVAQIPMQVLIYDKLPVIYIQVQRSLVQPNLLFIPENTDLDANWASPPLPGSLGNGSPVISLQNRYAWTPSFDTFQADLAAVPASETYSANKMPVLTGIGTVWENGQFFVQVQQGYLDVTNPAKPVYTSDPLVWFNSMNSAAVAVFNQSTNDISLDLQNVTMTSLSPIVSAGFSWSGNLIQLMAATNWPIHRAAVLQPSNQL